MGADTICWKGVFLVYLTRVLACFFIFDFFTARKKKERARLG